MIGLRSKSLKFLTLSCLSCLIVNALCAQLAEEMGDRALNSRVIEFVKENKFLEARPFLLEMKKRMAENKDKSNIEAIDFFLASTYLQEYQETKNKSALETAVKSFEEYIATYKTGPRRTIALLNLGDAYSDLKDFEKAIRIYSTIYNSPSTSSSVRADIRRVIAKTYLKTDTPEDGMAFYQEAYDQAFLDEEARAEATTWLLQAHISKGSIDAILPYFNNLTGRKAALFNPKFNVTLIKAGDKLFENGNYDFAILFYAIVKRKSDIVDFYEEAVKRLTQLLSFKEEGSDDAVALEKRLREAEANLNAVRGIREYDADLRWRTARVLLESERTWEALWSFYNLMLEYPEHEQAEEFLFLAFSQARAVKDDFMVLQLAKDYLSRDQYKKYSGQITFDLATYYQEQGDEEAFYKLITSYLDEGPEQDKVAAQILNLLAIYLTNNERFAELQERMDRYYMSFKGLRETRQSAKYWSSLSLMIGADYKKALKSLTEFTEEFGDESVFSEDAYYRLAIAHYGAQDVQGAYEKFSEFVERFPESPRRGEAELYLGDIKRENGQLEESLQHYRLVEKYTDQQSFINKAIFTLSEVLESLKRQQESAEVLLAYVDRYGEKAELGEAYMKLGKFEQAQGRISKRFEYNALGLGATANNPTRYAADEIIVAYVQDFNETVKNYEAAVDFIESMMDDSAFRNKVIKDRAAQYRFFQSEDGMDVDPDLEFKIVRDRDFRKKLIQSPDIVLRDLRSKYKDKLDRLSSLSPKIIFTKLITDAQEPKTVLKLRIAMARDIADNSDGDFNFTEEEVRNASPAVMLWWAKELRATDPAKANALLETSLEQHPYEPNRDQTLLTMAEIAVDRARKEPTKENLKEALFKYDNIIELFGMGAKDGEPYLAKGELLTKLEREDEAINVLNNVLRNPEWRGKPQAKAHLLIGLAYYNMGRFAEAHGFFERLMLGFGGFRDEVALAYYWDLKALESMNETESVNQLKEEIRSRDDLKGTQGYRLIEENYAL